jgi:ribosomal protein L37AE/L43A
MADEERCPECGLTADGRTAEGDLVWGCCLNDDWHGSHRPTDEQQRARDEETRRLMEGLH